MPGVWDRRIVDDDAAKFGDKLMRDKASKRLDEKLQKAVRDRAFYADLRWFFGQAGLLMKDYV